MPDFYYRDIPEAEVEPEKAREARRYLDYCKGVLGNIAGVEIQWCTMTEESGYKLDHLYEELERRLGRLAGDYGLGREIKKSAYNKTDGAFLGLAKGYFGDNKIWIRSDILLGEIGLTVAHECRHLSDFGAKGKYRPPFRWETEYSRRLEDGAEEFARGVVKALGRKRE